MKRLIIFLSMMLFAGLGAVQAQAMTLTGGITLAYCSYIEYNFDVANYPDPIDAVTVRFYTDSDNQFFSIAHVPRFNPNSFALNTSIALYANNITLPANTNVQIKIFVNQVDENATPDFVSGFVPCIGSSFDINVPVELPEPPEEDDFLFGYNPNMSGWKAAVYPLNGAGGFQIIGNFGNFIVTEDDLAELPENPETNILLAGQPDRYALYYLTTGEFQINLAPDIEGKVITIIFNLETGEFYTREFNLYDVLEGTR